MCNGEKGKKTSRVHSVHLSIWKSHALLTGQHAQRNLQTAIFISTISLKWSRLDWAKLWMDSYKVFKRIKNSSKILLLSKKLHNFVINSMCFAISLFERWNPVHTLYSWTGVISIAFPNVVIPWNKLKKIFCDFFPSQSTNNCKFKTLISYLIHRCQLM